MGIGDLVGCPLFLVFKIFVHGVVERQTALDDLWLGQRSRKPYSLWDRHRWGSGDRRRLPQGGLNGGIGPSGLVVGPELLPREGQSHDGDFGSGLIAAQVEAAGFAVRVMADVFDEAGVPAGLLEGQFHARTHRT